MFLGTQHIECVNYDGRGRRVVYDLASYPFGLAYANRMFYWTDWTMCVDINKQYSILKLQNNFAMSSDDYLIFIFFYFLLIGTVSPASHVMEELQMIPWSCLLVVMATCLASQLLTKGVQQVTQSALMQSAKYQIQKKANDKTLKINLQ